MSKSKVIIIGFGHHAKRIYFPVLQSLQNAGLVGLVDLKTQKEKVDEFLKLNNADIPALYLEENEKNYNRLTQFATDLEANAVIISTDPENHVSLTKWALSYGLHVLMDKPIHAEPKAAHDISAARSIHEKYLELKADLLDAREQYPSLVCEVLSQRRYHPVYQLMRKAVIDGYRQTGCPITYYYSYHSDGQFRFPEEVRDMEYHGFNKGFGKASHSGYHFFDMLNWLSEAYRSDFSINRLTCSSWANFPSNYFKQVKPRTLQKLFGDYEAIDSHLGFDYSGYGEIDVMSRVQLKSDNDVITHAQIDLQHSGLSARSWSHIGERNVYKGNGRIRHEQYYISMGPFLAVSLTSWQGLTFNKEKLDKDTIFQPGHEFNVDLIIFRNKILGGKEIETYKLNDLYSPSLRDYSRGHQEDARRNGIREFFELIAAGIPDGSSSLINHSLSSQIMSTIYESVATKAEVSNTLRS